MTIASPSTRWHRLLTICAASVLLHYLAIGWVGARIGAMPREEESARPPPIVAQLLAAPAAVPQARPAPIRHRPARAAPAGKRVPARLPLPAPLADEVHVPLALAEPGAVAALVDVKSPEPDPAPAPGPRFKVSLPPSAELTLDVARTDASGASWTGKSVMDWSSDGSRYRMTMVASITMVVTVNLAQLASEGDIDAAGIAPRKMTEKRRNKAQTATHFNRETDRISFSASEAMYPLHPGMQDKTTFALQLAGIARADPQQLMGGIEMVVGEEKDAALYRFVVLGQEEIDTRMGRINTWRLSRPPRPGEYKSRVDVWLAPGYDWYPVQLQATEANGAVTTQTISKIVVKESGK